MENNIERFFFVSKDGVCVDEYGENFRDSPCFNFNNLPLNDSYFDNEESPFTSNSLPIANKYNSSESNSSQVVDSYGAKSEDFQFLYVLNQDDRADAQQDDISGCTLTNLSMSNLVCDGSRGDMNQSCNNFPAVDHVAELLGRKKDIMRMEWTISNEREKHQKMNDPFCEQHTAVIENQVKEEQHEDDDNNERKKESNSINFVEEEQYESVWMKRRKKRVAILLRSKANSTNSRQSLGKADLKSKHDGDVDDDGFFIKG